MGTVLTLPLPCVSKVALIQESISNGIVLVMTSQSVQQRSAHDAMLNPSPALLAEKG